MAFLLGSGPWRLGRSFGHAARAAQQTLPHSHNPARITNEHALFQSIYMPGIATRKIKWAARAAVPVNWQRPPAPVSARNCRDCRDCRNCQSRLIAKYPEQRSSPDISCIAGSGIPYSSRLAAKKPRSSSAHSAPRTPPICQRLWLALCASKYSARETTAPACESAAP